MLITVWVISSAVTTSAATRDVAIIYDYSGSMNRQRTDILRAANDAIVNLLTDGQRPPAEQWLLSASDGADELFAGANIDVGSQVAFLAFNQPHKCEAPFFTSTNARILALESAPADIQRLLPEPSAIRFKDWTYLELAKWQAVADLESSSDATTRWLFVIVSDFIKDMEGGPCATSSLAMQKIQEFNTQYEERTLLQANWRLGTNEVSLLGFRVYEIRPRVEASAPTITGTDTADVAPEPERTQPPPESVTPVQWNFLWLILISAAVFVLYHIFRRFNRKRSP